MGRNLYASEWMPGGQGIVVAGNDHVTVGVWLQPVDGPPTRLDLGDLVVAGSYGYELTVGKSGAIFFVATSASRPAELYVMEKPSWKRRRLTDFNAWATSEFIGFTGRTHASADPVNARERLRLWVDWVKRHIGGGALPGPGR